MIPPDDPRHGTKRGHILGCREDCCRLANARYQNLWRAGRTNKTIDGTGTRRRVQALQALGWPSTRISEAAGWSSGDRVREILRVARAEADVWLTTATRIRRAYDALSMTPGPDELVRQRAQRKGWLPPLFWDDETIDDPRAKPYREKVADRWSVDEVLVQRAVDGFKVDANPRERRLIVARCKAAGRSLNELDRVQGWNVHRDERTAQQRAQQQQPEAS